MQGALTGTEQKMFEDKFAGFPDTFGDGLFGMPHRRKQHNDDFIRPLLQGRK